MMYRVFLSSCMLSLVLEAAMSFHPSSPYFKLRNRAGCGVKLHLFFNGPTEKTLPAVSKPLNFGEAERSIENQLLNQKGYRLRFEPSTADDEGSSHVLVLDRAEAKLDLRAIVDMNIREYGSGPAVFPLDNPKLIGSFFSRQILMTLIEWSMRLKLLLREDHIIYVAKLESRVNDQNVDFVGMIEISLQPVLRERNPPPFPIPFAAKRWIASANGVELQGWITNLLVVPECRGLGYSKLLVRGSEIVAQREWSCSSIHLHCDADPVSGSIPRKLYASMGYKELPDNQSLVCVDGVSLWYLSKYMHNDFT